MTTAAAPLPNAAPLAPRRDAFGAARVVAIMLTRRCDIACGHCSVVSGPDVRGPEPPLDDLLEAVRAAAAAGAGAIQLTGGEPMLRRDVALELLREARRLGIASAITTNGSWGRTLDEARAALREAEGVVLVDGGEEYITPAECVGEYAVFVSRVRKDPTVRYGLNLWVVSDNLRKGAALNAVQIAEAMVEDGLL